MSNGSSPGAWSKESSDLERGGQYIKGKAICGQIGEWWFGECPQDIWGGCLPNQHSGLRDKHFLKERSGGQKRECV